MMTMMVTMPMMMMIDGDDKNDDDPTSQQELVLIRKTVNLIKAKLNESNNLQNRKNAYLGLGKAHRKANWMRRSSRECLVLLLTL